MWTKTLVQDWQLSKQIKELASTKTNLAIFKIPVYELNSYKTTLLTPGVPLKLDIIPLKYN